MGVKRIVKWLVAGIVIMPVFIIFSTVAQEDAPDNLTIHVVQRGENLFRIALQYGITTEELATLNGILNPSNILVGQRLLVPAGEQPALPQTHVVQAGDTLGSIAERYQVDINQLIENNALSNPNQLYVGQTLQIVPEQRTQETSTSEDVESAPVEETGLTAGVLLHAVQSGDTLFRIAQMYGITMNEVAVANNISDPTRIFVGQQLIIPNVNLPEMPIELPAPLIDLNVTPMLFVEGQTGSISLTTSEATVIEGTFLGRDLRVISLDDGRLHHILVGVPAFTEGDIYEVNLLLETETSPEAIEFNFSIRVLDGGYGTQNLTISAELEALLSPAVEEYEIGLLTRATSRFSDERRYGTALSLPAAAPMNSAYGIRRSYNGGEVTRYHNGADFATIPGTPIFAAADGVVVLADLLNIRGNAIVLDHGWGVFTTYSHLNETLVTIGETVRSGQTIGLSGSTGRVTGAHLHWEVWVNGVAVNPMQWVQQAFP